MGDTHQTHTYELMSPGPHDLSRYMPPSAMNGGSLLSMYSAAVPCGTWNPPSIIANGMSSDAGFQCRFRWLMNQLFICFGSSPVIAASLTLSSSCKRHRINIIPKILTFEQC